MPLCSDFERDPAEITLSQVEHACKNAIFLQSLHLHSIAEEIEVDPVHLETVSTQMMLKSCDMSSDIDWYLCLRAVDSFVHRVGRFPGDVSDDMLEVELLFFVLLLSCDSFCYSLMCTICVRICPLF